MSESARLHYSISHLKPVGHRQRISREDADSLRERGLKRCPDCRQDKPLEAFGANGYCRPCGSSRTGARYPGSAADGLRSKQAGLSLALIKRLEQTIGQLHEFRNQLALARIEVDAAIGEFEAATLSIPERTAAAKS